MLQAGRGDLTAAVSTAELAVAEHQRLPMPFERARTQLLLGQLQRPKRRRDAATTTLHEALQTFQNIGHHRVGRARQSRTGTRALQAGTVTKD